MERMKKIDTAYDEVLKSNYDLYKVKLSDLKEIAKSWYEGFDLKEFDKRCDHQVGIENDAEKHSFIQAAGVTSNYFFAYKEDDKHYLMDGYNRLFTEYGEKNLDAIVYIKILTTPLKDHELMKAMVYLNAWKLYNSGHSYGGFKIDNFLDRGFRLFMKSKFDITFDSNGEYRTRTREESDFYAIDYYFHGEYEICADFKYPVYAVVQLLGHERIVDDIKELLKSNDYMKQPFPHYQTFFYGFMMFLSRERLRGNMTKQTLEMYIERLKEDKKFFKKLQGMSWTDPTRKNIFKFFEKVEEELKEKTKIIICNK